MDSLNDIMSHKDFEEPPEVTAIKQFVKRTFQSDVGVQIQTNAIIITAKSAALASSLRYQLPQLQKEAATTKRLVLRIGA